MLRKHFLNVCIPLVVGRMAWESMNFAIFADLLYRSSRCRFKYGYLKIFCTALHRANATFATLYDAQGCSKVEPIAWYGVLVLLMSINTWNLEIDFWKKNCNICNFSSRTPRKVLNRKQRTPKNGMGPMLEGLLGPYGVG